jgi:hypothetical protein
MTISELLLIAAFRQLTAVQQAAIIDQLRIARSLLIKIEQPLNRRLKIA